MRKQIDGAVKRLEAKKAARGPQELAEDQKLMSYTIQKKFQETEQDAYEALMEFENKKAHEDMKAFQREHKKKLSKKQVKYYVDSNAKFTGFRVSIVCKASACFQRSNMLIM